MTPSRLVVFLAIALAVLGGIHFYFWWRLVRDTHMPAPYRAWATAALAALAISLPLALVVGRALHPAARGWVAWPAFLWMGFMFLLFVGLLGTDVLRLGLRLGDVVQGVPTDPQRRTFLARLLGALAGGTAGIVGAYGVVEAVARLRVVPVKVALRRLPPKLAGLRIVQVTDIHLGPTIGRGFAEKLVRMTNAEQPDIIAITGDLVDGSVKDLREAAAPLAGLRARWGVYFVTGNHEYYSGVEDWLAELQRLGIKVLRNEHVVLGEPDAQWVLAGVDDASAHGFGDGHGADVPRALRGKPGDAPVVLLAHQPKTIRQAQAHGVDLQLSGHTHGGQIWPFSLLVRLDQPYVHGLHRAGEGQIYVSPGTGYWGPPLRVGTRAEITRLELYPAHEASDEVSG